MNYSKELKDALLRRMLPPNNESIIKISKEEGISEQTKEEIMETDIPYIINKGRKGGSNVAAAICNAVLYELSGRKCV